MQLSDLFVSHKQVDPVKFERDKPDLPQPIYINLDRAQQAVSGGSDSSNEEPIVTEAMSSWRVGSEEESLNNQTSGLNKWVVDGMSTVPSTTGSKPYTSQSNRTTVKMGNTERAKYWADKFAAYGLSEAQQIAVVAAMRTECGLNPIGAVNKEELAGKGNTKPGWAHAGEGTIGITHWSTKKRLIEKYNADPRRKGPKLSTNEVEYAKTNSRHIADLDEDDHALITLLYYEPLLRRIKPGSSFQDTVAEFYLSKAGRGFAKGATPYDHAVATGEHYQKSHARQGYIKASKTNQFLKSLDYASALAQSLGYSV